MRAALLPAALLAAMLAAFAASAETLRVDPAHSHAEFGVHVLWFGKIVGRLDGLDGTMRVDRRQHLAEVDVRVAAASVQMAHRSFTEWARGADFFGYPDLAVFLGSQPPGLQ